MESTTTTEQPNLSLQNTLSEERTLKQDMNSIKRKLRKKKAFLEGVEELCQKMKESLNYSTKKLFYDALNILSYRVGKPGFDAAAAKKAFDIAKANINVFSAGYRRNISDWAQEIDKLVSKNDSSASTRTDGRFNSVRTDMPRRRTVPTLSAVRDNLLQLMILRHMLGMADDMEGTGYSSSDDEGSFGGFFPFSFSSDSFDTSDEPSYPYIQYEEEDILSPFKVPHHENSFKASFTLTETQMKSFQENKSKKLVLAVIGEGDKFSDTLPLGSTCRVNGSSVSTSANENNRKFAGYNITSFVHKGSNELVLVFGQCVCRFEFSLKIAEEFSVDDLVEQVKTKNALDYDTCFSRIKTLFKVDEEIEQLSVPTSLKDPLVQTRIDIPARGEHCSHAQCFDLKSYLLINEKFPKFKCPACSKVTPFEELVMDGYFARVLQEVKNDEELEEVAIQPDGTYQKVTLDRKRKSQLSDETSSKRQKLSGSSTPESESSSPDTVSTSNIIVDLTE